MNVSPVNSGMITGATRMNSARERAEHDRIRQNSAAASRKASRLRLLEQLGEDRHERGARCAASANSARTRFGTWKAIVNAEKRPLVPK